MKGWITKTIGELCDAGGGRVQTGPFGSQLHESDYSETGIPVVMPKDILGSQIDETDIARISENHVHRLRRHKLAKGDIVYGRRGDIGRQALVHAGYVGWLCGTGCLRITLGKASVTPQFLHRYLQLPEVIRWIEGQAIGATMPNLNTNILRRIPVTFPVLDTTQQKITALLSAYDEQIENNNRLIALLEQLAEDIYREWFVRLRFPGHETVKKIKGLPETWTIRTISALCLKITDGAHASPVFTDGGKPMASVKDMHAHGFSLETVKTISDNDFEALKKADCQPLKNDVLIAKDGSYLKHAFVWDHEYDIVILSSIAILRPNLERIQPYYLAQVLKQESTKAMMTGYVSGAALPRIILKDFMKMRLLVPTFDLVKAFEDIVAPIYRRIHLAIRQTDQLRYQQGKLLPRLISGNLSVENFNIQFPPAMAKELNAEPTTTAYA